MQSVGHAQVPSLFPTPRRARILVVDDDELVLRSIGRLLRGRDAGWDVLFLGSGEAALRELARAPVDVIVSDVHMGALGGARLLAHVQENYPDVARIILSGESDPRIAFRTVSFAHQFLAKPFDAERLKSTLGRACALRSLLTNESIRALVGRSNELPAAPATYLELTRALRDPSISTGRIATIIERDVGIAARVLQMASSSFFGLPRTVSSIAGAVGFLGLDTLRTLVLACEIVRTFQPGSRLDGFSMDRFQEHSLRTARLARLMLGQDPDSEDAFVAGLLHSIGLLVLASRAPHRLAEVFAQGEATSQPLIPTERALLGITHAEVGAYLLGLWGIRQQVVEAVAYHARPERIDSSWGLASTLHVASILARDPEALVDPDGSEAMGALPGTHIERMGMSDRLEGWRAIARLLHHSPRASERPR